MSAVWLFFTLWGLRLILALAMGQHEVSSKQSQLWLGRKQHQFKITQLLMPPSITTDCSCMHATERNATQWGSLVVNASHALGAKNNCLMIFVGGTSDELVEFQMKQLQLRHG